MCSVIVSVDLCIEIVRTTTLPPGVNPIAVVKYTYIHIYIYTYIYTNERSGVAPGTIILVPTGWTQIFVCKHCI